LVELGLNETQSKQVSLCPHNNYQRISPSPLLTTEF
jgi:hypothetical protein